MSPAPRLSARFWVIAPICAVLFLAWSDFCRMQRVEYVSGIASEDAVVDPASPTGYAGGKRWLLVPEHDNHSYQWIAETQQMLARHEWRVRHVDYENAPYGREVHSASPYRWWLGLLAWCDHVVSDRPLGLSVARAALFADPLLHVLLLIVTAALVARWFGAFPAALVSVGLATVFPLAAQFLPGVPDCFGLTQACALWSVLPLLAAAGGAAPGTNSKNKPGAAGPADPNRRKRRLFFLAGIAGGCGLWVSAADQVLIVEGIAVGAILAALVAPPGAKAASGDSAEAAPWRAWALGGAITCLLAYLIEYFPSHLDLRLRVNHPLYGLAWLGLGELLAWFSSWRQQGRVFRGWPDAVRIAVALAAIAALPVEIFRTGNQTFLAGDLLATRLTNLPDGVTAKNLWTWFTQAGPTAMIAATCLPVLLLGPAVRLLLRRSTDARRRCAVAIACGPVAVALTLACFQLRWWSLADTALLALLVAATAFAPHLNRWLWAAFAGLLLAPGVWQLMPAATGGTSAFKFTRAEVEELYERALAQWIADHAGPDGAVVLVPPFRTSAFCFYGGLRGLGTQNWENREGLLATFRIATATRPEETQALINERGVNYIVIPSWDTDLDEFARMGLKQPEGSFIYALQHWVLFDWLRPLPYQLPQVAGFEGQSVKVLQVTDETDPATERSRLVEYFVEMQQLDIADYSSRALRRYPADLGAVVALAQVEKARNEEQNFATDLSTIVSYVTGGSARSMAWDRRVSLAVVLALGQRRDLAREQVRLCLEHIDDARIRSLTTGSLYHLLVLCRAFGLELPAPHQRELALHLLPAELRSRL